MAQALNDILTELNGVYQPQKDLYNQQIQQLDPQMQAEQKGLDAAKSDAFSQITDQANRRGLFYSGIPVSEEQKYTGASYLPAVANLHSRYAQQRFNLQDALAKITQEQYLKGQDIYQTQLNRDAASRASGGAGGFGGLGDLSGVLGAGSNIPQGQYGRATQKADGGFAFVDHTGKPISAAQYSQASGIPFRTLLQNMAQAGDKGAQAALGFVGNDFGYDPNKIGAYGSTYNNLVWGTGKQFSGASGGPGIGQYVKAPAVTALNPIKPTVFNPLGR